MIKARPLDTARRTRPVGQMFFWLQSPPAASYEGISAVLSDLEGFGPRAVFRDKPALQVDEF